jgi:hypothetical protein
MWSGPKSYGVQSPVGTRDSSWLSVTLYIIRQKNVIGLIDKNMSLTKRPYI